MNQTLAPSVYYPTAQSVTKLPKRELAFAGCAWWIEAPEEFRKLKEQACWVNKLETREDIIATWREHPDVIHFLEWAKQEGGGKIDPVIIGGTYGGWDEWGVASNVQLMLYYPGHSRNTNEK